MFTYCQVRSECYGFAPACFIGSEFVNNLALETEISFLVVSPEMQPQGRQSGRSFLVAVNVLLTCHMYACMGIVAPNVGIAGALTAA